MVAKRWPEIADVDGEIRAGFVHVNGFPVRNPDALVDRGASIAIRRPQPLRGEAKLRAALAAFDVDPAGAVCVDVGAAAGGFTKVLLEHGAARVYAVDVGHGQLVGSLRQDPRCVVLERTNLSALDAARVPDVVDLITIDVSYVSLAAAIPQLGGMTVRDGADLVALVKPMYELGRAELPDPSELPAAVAAASAGIEAAGWTVVATMESPVRGSRDAVEGLLHARRR